MTLELKKAQFLWNHLAQHDLAGVSKVDELLSNNDLLENPFPERPPEGWLKCCREAQLRNQAEIATRLNTTQQAYAKLESNEVTGALSLENLQKAAAALDCELIYFLRPKNKKSFSAILWEHLLPRALKKHKQRTRSQRTPLKASVLAHIAFELFKDPAVRRELRWIRNRNS